MNSSITQSNAAVIKEFVNHPGMKLLVEAIQGQIKNKELTWLNAKDANEAETLRQNARCYAALMGTLNSFLLKAKVDETNGQSNV